VFLPRWLAAERALSGAEIGALLSLSQLTRIVLGPAIAFWADGHVDRRTPIRLLAPAAIAAFLVFFFLAHDFTTLLVTGFAALTLMNAITPLVESAALRATATGKVSYGTEGGYYQNAEIATIVCGPGHIAQAHQPDEWIAQEQLDACDAFIRRLVDRVLL